MKPTRKGIRMSVDCFVRLMRMEMLLQNLLDKMKAGEQVHERLTVGGPLFLKLDSPFLTIHLREYYKDDKDELRPARAGIVLKLRHWQKIIKLAGKELDAVIPNFSEMKPCYMENDHSNQEGMLNCFMCNYFDGCAFADDDY